MRPLRHLFTTITSFENLYRAYLNARRGKRDHGTVIDFDQRLEENLVGLQRALVSGCYQPGKYRTFIIHEPKRRLISAAPFRDRVVHHAIIDVIEPLLDASLIEDSYACRCGKGTHKALDRCQQFARRCEWVLHCDVRKYFPSIDHGLLQEMLRKRIGDQKVLQLLFLILDSGPVQEPVLAWFDGDDLLTPIVRRRGLPIGNLTSQFFANLFLDPLDRMIKQRLRIRGYVRYMDDLVVFGRSVQELRKVRAVVEETLNALRLELHPKKRQIYPVRNGIPFLGFRVFPNHRRLLPENVDRQRVRLRIKVQQYNKQQIDSKSFYQSLQAWIGHASHGDTWRLRGRLFRELVRLRARGSMG